MRSDEWFAIPDVSAFKPPVNAVRRDYFAARAMQSLIFGSNIYENNPDEYKAVAKKAVMAADALIEELKK